MGRKSRSDRSQLSHVSKSLEIDAPSQPIFQSSRACYLGAMRHDQPHETKLSAKIKASNKGKLYSPVGGL